MILDLRILGTYCTVHTHVSSGSVLAGRHNISIPLLAAPPSSSVPLSAPTSISSAPTIPLAFKSDTSPRLPSQPPLPYVFV